MLVSVHMPKTAGLSFRASLEEQFGEQFQHDYQDYPLAQAPQARREQAQRFGAQVKAADFASVGCIHGHFLPLKYLPLADKMPCTFVTWLREPVARLVSHYHYWQRSYDPAGDSTSPLHRRVVEEGWSLERFCLAPELRNIYTEFLWGFPADRLDFIGITEFFPEDLRYFSREILGNNVRAHTLNTRVDSGAPDLDGSARATLERFHAADMALYRRALRLRGQRRNAWPSCDPGAACN